jgi:hypothetical protein
MAADTIASGRGLSTPSMPGSAPTVNAPLLIAARTADQANPLDGVQQSGAVELYAGLEGMVITGVADYAPDRLLF